MCKHKVYGNTCHQGEKMESNVHKDQGQGSMTQCIACCRLHLFSWAEVSLL